MLSASCYTASGCFKLELCTRAQAQKLPDFNILCEKCAFEGMTRFEDRFKQPLGISVNFTSYAARLLTQARFALLPDRILTPRLGDLTPESANI